MIISENEAIQVVSAWRSLVNLYTSRNIPITVFLDYFGGDNCFKITEENIRFWGEQLINEKEGERKIHIYAGIHNCKFYVYLIDSKNDRIRNFENTIFRKELIYKDINKTIFGELDFEKAKTRINRWVNFKKDWLTAVQGEQMFRIIEIGYDDYVKLNLAEGESCLNFLALEKPNPQGINEQIEVIAVKEHNGTHVAEDFSSPRPPFHVPLSHNNYQLLLLSDQPNNVDAFV